MDNPRRTQSFWACLMGLCGRYKALSLGHRVIVLTVLIWAAQAIPKWTVAILADGETAAAIMAVFVPPPPLL
ncbi:MAG: hypothetical protein U5S82_11195 [Gammaproteobacteria bacterium]|nr:hypothetical protein [Gammaproteobacteria bacterium]